MGFKKSNRSASGCRTNSATMCIGWYLPKGARRVDEATSAARRTTITSMRPCTSSDWKSGKRSAAAAGEEPHGSAPPGARPSRPVG